MRAFIYKLRVIMFGRRAVLPTLPTQSRLICQNIWQTTNTMDDSSYNLRHYDE